MATFSGPEIALLVVFASFICGVAGGYGGLKLLARGLRRDLGEVGADLESFDLRIKKLEGRNVRQQQQNQRGQPPPELLELAAALKGGPQLVRAPQQETEAEIINRTFPGTAKVENE